MGTSNAAIRVGFAVFLVALLAGCGGGGGQRTAPGDSADGRHRPPARPLTCTQLAGMTIPAVVDRPADLRRSGDVCGGGPRRRHRRRGDSGALPGQREDLPGRHHRARHPVQSRAADKLEHQGRHVRRRRLQRHHPQRRRQCACRAERSAAPLGRGYATFASDSGHQANALGSLDGSFGLNDEAIRNWSGEALKKTRDAAVFLIKARYAVDSIRKAYFAGGSTGGREALESITRWPDDWDGAIAWYPAWKQASAILAGHAVSRALAKPGAYPASAAKRELLFNAAMEACDGLDGAIDRLINNQLRCNATFDPATASVNGAPLRCPDGADTGDTCLSDAQITALKTLNSDTRFNFELASGEDQLPGLQHVGRRPRYHHAHVAAGADRHLPGPRHVAAHAADAVHRALHQQDDGSVDPVFHHPLARL